jgi:parallel beta-helix repeat protein
MRAVLVLAPIGLALSVASAAVIVVPDDQPTIQAAVDAAAAGDVVQVRPGTWAESVSIVDPLKPGLTVEGLGGRPVVTPPAGTNGFYVRKVDGITLRGLAIQGGARGVRLDTSVGSTLDDLVATGQTRDGLLVRNGSGNTVTGSSVTGAFVDGIRVERSDAAVVSGNVVAGSGRRGLQVKNAQTATVTGNAVSGSGRDGLEVLHVVTSAVVTGNVSSASGRVGFRVKKLTNATVTGNSATGAVREGIEVHRLTTSTLDGNTGHGNGYTGIRIRRGESLAVANNQANGNGRYGFWVQATPPIASPTDLTAAGNAAAGNTLGDYRVD